MKFYLKTIAVCMLIMALTVGIYTVVYNVLSLDDRKEDSVAVISRQEDRIFSVQRRLSSLEYYDGDVTGIYDFNTSESVKRFQNESGVYPSGELTPETLNALNIYISLDEIIEYENIRLIASATESVCGKAPYLVKVAFAGMIINQINSAGFPSDPSSVVFSDSLTKYSENYDRRAEPLSETFRAVREAMLGLSPCPDASYFFLYSSNETLISEVKIKYRNGIYCFA